MLRIVIAAVLLAGAVILEHTCELSKWQLLGIYLIPYIIVGYDVLAEAGESLLKGRAMDENFLMSIATIGALAIGFLPNGEMEFAEAVVVMLLFQVGELFEHYAEGKSRKSISHLMDIRPDTANVIRNNGITSVDPTTVKIGETIIIRPGEKIPLDGSIVEGSSSLNTVALTGESMPRDVSVGDEVVSGCVNISGVIKVRVRSLFTESTVSKIIRLVESAGEKKSKSEIFITRFAKVYTPIVVFTAIVLAIVLPTILLVMDNDGAPFAVWLVRALTFLVISCPCALVISVPLTFFAGIGGASRRGILIKGSCYIDTLAKTEIVVFDKTGTLTKGQFEVVAIHPDNFDERQLLHLAAHVERYSHHPIAISLKNAFPNEDDDCSVEEVKEIAGRGVTALVNNKNVSVGNSEMMKDLGIDWHPCHRTGTIAHVAVDGVYIGHIVISDKLKEDAKLAITKLKAAGIEKTVMLTGDSQETAKEVALATGIDEYHAGMLPSDKVEVTEKLMTTKSVGKSLVFVGDGINDAPVLARADVGMAMGTLGSDAAIEAADVVIMDDKPSKVADAISISRHTLRIATENIVFALTVKVIILLLALFGFATMWMAVFADVGVCVIAVFNAMRALRGSLVKA